MASWFCLFSPLVYNEHTSIDCERYEGEVYKDDIYSFCKFDRPICPYGWTQFESWSETEGSGVIDNYMGKDCHDDCKTGSHVFMNRGIESCDGQEVKRNDNDNYVCTDATAYATVTKVGCY